MHLLFKKAKSMICDSEFLQEHPVPPAILCLTRNTKHNSWDSQQHFDNILYTRI